MMAIIGAEFKNSGVERDQFDNATYNLNYEQLNLTFRENALDKTNPFITRAVMYYADFLAFVGVEGSKNAMEYGYKNPQYNFKFVFWALSISAFAILIVPLIHLLTFMGFCFYYLYRWITDIANKKKKSQIGKNDQSSYN